MQKLVKLKQVAKTISGYTIRQCVVESSVGPIRILQAKNLQDSPYVLAQNLTRCDIYTSHTAAFIVNGDVAIGSRGVFRAAVVHADEKVLAASSVYLLRVRNQNTVLPEYLASYLNSATGQKRLYPHLTSGTIRTLPKKSLENIEILLPSLQQQKIIVRLAESVREQGRLLNDKIRIQKNIINGIFTRMETSLS